ERTRLQVTQVMRIGGLATADEAWLLSDRAKVLPVAITPWGCNGENALVDADGLLLARLLLMIGVGNSGGVIFRGTCPRQSKRRQPLFKGVLYELGIGRRELVLGGQRLLRPAHGSLSRGDLANFRQQPIAQGGGLLTVNNLGRSDLHECAATPIAGLARWHPRLIGPLLEPAVGG